MGIGLKNIFIRNTAIGPGNEPYVIAELSANHNGSIENAKKLIGMAKKCGADAVKIQTYTADTITLNTSNKEFQIDTGLWAGRTLYDLYSEGSMPWDWHEELFECAREIDITIFSSPFDSTAVDLLESLNAPAYKIASFELIDLPLIKYVAQTKKPMIISTGMAKKDEISEAVQIARENGCSQIAVLHCVSGYPAVPSEYNLRTITDITNSFDVIGGLSDHTIENSTAIASIPLGASIIEKHFTLDRNGGGPDDSFSLDENGLLELCKGVKTAYKSLGKVDYGLKSSEASNIKFRRSLYFIKNMKQGEIIDKESIKSIRPGYGMLPKYFDEIIGKKVLRDVNFADPVTWDCIDD